jgi:hypothetical protein
MRGNCAGHPNHKAMILAQAAAPCRRHNFFPLLRMARLSWLAECSCLDYQQCSYLLGELFKLQLDNVIHVTPHVRPTCVTPHDHNYLTVIDQTNQQNITKPISINHMRVHVTFDREHDCHQSLHLLMFFAPTNNMVVRLHIFSSEVVLQTTSIHQSIMVQAPPSRE